MGELRQQFDEHAVLTLGALALHDAISVNSKIDATREQGFRIVKSVYHISLRDKTTQQGPIMFGVGLNTDAAGVEAALEADPQNRTDEISHPDGVFIKPITQVSRIMANSNSTGPLDPGIEVSYGKNGWSVIEGEKMMFWAYNMGDATLTTGTVFDIFVEHFGVWLND